MTGDPHSNRKPKPKPKPKPSIDEAEAARAIAIGRHAADEIDAVLRTTRMPKMARAAVALLAKAPSARLGGLLARFDASIARVGISAAAREVLDSLGATVDADVERSVPSSGAMLVVVNHPGAYDAFALMAALARDDVAFVATDRSFLRAMPWLCEHLVFVADAHISGRASTVRHALRWLDRGKLLIQFGAGAIEPDARFIERRERRRVREPGEDRLLAWTEGTGWLAGRAAERGAAVVPTFVSGVHSPRAKRLFFVRWAERRGITTIAPLVQATLPGFRDVVVSVKIGAPINPAVLCDAASDVRRASIVREATAALFETR